MGQLTIRHEAKMVEIQGRALGTWTDAQSAALEASMAEQDEWYQEVGYPCDGICRECYDDDCPEHPSNAHLYNPLSVCSYAGIGSYNPADYSCQRCGLREECEAEWERILEEETQPA